MKKEQTEEPARAMAFGSIRDKDLPSFDPEITVQEAEMICGKNIGTLNSEDRIVVVAMKYLNFEQKFKHATRRYDEYEQVDALYRAVKGKADDRLWRTKLDRTRPMFEKLRSWYARNDGGCLERSAIGDVTVRYNPSRRVCSGIFNEVHDTGGKNAAVPGSPAH